MFYRTQGTMDSEDIRYMGTEKSYDLKALFDDIEYDTLDESNFIVQPIAGLNVPDHRKSTSSSHSGGGDYINVSSSSYSYYTLTKSYNKETGIFTCNISTNAGQPSLNVWLYRKFD